MLNLKLKILFFLLAIVLPQTSVALQMPSSGNDIAQMANVSSPSFVVADARDGRIIFSKDADMPWVPASLTKLVTALVFLDSKPDMNKVVKITAQDQSGGGCSQGGACIATKPGVSYRLKDLFHASVVASANNATMAMARSTGLSKSEFAKKMNEKAQELGATHTYFVEPTGMSPLNTTTAADFVKIARVALNNPVIAKAAVMPNYNFTAYNNKKYSHRLKSTNKLLGDLDLEVLAGKTGYLEESRYNFVSLVQNRFGNKFIVSVLGSQSQAAQFKETKELAALGSLALAFSNFTNSAVLGSSTEATTINN